jgi:hypothetical protein
MEHQAIYNTHSNAKSIIENEDGSLSVYDQDNNEITLNGSEVAEQARLQAEWDAQAYARNRKAKYDALNQFELISDDSINGTTTHKDAILAIKAEFPKP